MTTKTRYTLVMDAVRDEPTAYVRDEKGNTIDAVSIPDEWWDDMPADAEVKALARRQCPCLRGNEFAIESPC